MGGDEERYRRDNQKNESGKTKGFSETIKILYRLGLELGLKYNEMYDLDFQELQDTIVYMRKGLAKNIWRLASLTRHPYIKNFPESPEEAFPDLFPPKPTIKMPDFLKEKWLKRGGK